MAETVDVQVTLSDAQQDLFEKVVDLGEQLVETSIEQQNQHGFVTPHEAEKLSKKTILTLQGLGTAVSERLNDGHCIGERPNTFATVTYDEKFDDIETGFVISCVNLCAAALGERCPLSRLPRKVTTELEDLEFRASYDLANARARRAA